MGAHQSTHVVGDGGGEVTDGGATLKKHRGGLEHLLGDVKLTSYVAELQASPMEPEKNFLQKNNEPGIVRTPSQNLHQQQAPT